MKKLLLFLIILPSLLFADAVIFSGNDVKTLKPNIDLFGVGGLQSASLQSRATDCGCFDSLIPRTLIFMYFVLGAYSLGAYSLGQPILDLATHSSRDD